MNAPSMTPASKAWIAARQEELKKYCPGHDTASTMCSFLNSPIIFQWSNKTTEDTCEGKFHPAIKYVRNLDYCKRSKNAFVHEYKFQPQKSDFTHTFAVKRYGKIASKEKTKKEINNMKDLRHPHVAALLGTFTSSRGLHILSFPAACFDLELFMQWISHDITQSEKEPQKPTVPGECPNYNWPLTVPKDSKLMALQSYFYCLVRALEYVHKSGIRHKDIKPGNILIDLSGAIILTDFGIAKKFEYGHSLETTTGIEYTNAYAAPECKDRTGRVRNEKTDVFSLGCVFLEMASLLLGRSIEECRNPCGRMGDDGLELDYSRHLSEAHNWISELSNTPADVAPYQTLREEIPLETINRMLEDSDSMRPKANGELADKFFFKRLGMCRDCHPESPTFWRPSREQQKKEETGRKTRKAKSAMLDTLQDPGRRSPRPASNPHATGPLSIPRTITPLSLNQGDRPVSPEGLNLGPREGRAGPSFRFPETRPDDPNVVTARRVSDPRTVIIDHRSRTNSPYFNRPPDAFNQIGGHPLPSPPPSRHVDEGWQMVHVRDVEETVPMSGQVMMDRSLGLPPEYLDPSHIDPSDHTSILLYDYDKGRLSTIPKYLLITIGMHSLCLRPDRAKTSRFTISRDRNRRLQECR